MVTPYKFKELYSEQKGVKSAGNGFQDMELKIICKNFVLVELIRLLVFSVDVIRDVNMKNTQLFTFGNTKLQYMSAINPIAAKQN